MADCALLAVIEELIELVLIACIVFEFHSAKQHQLSRMKT